MNNAEVEVRYGLPLDLLEQVAAYLIQRPYREVFHLMRRMDSEVIRVEIPLPADDSAGEPLGQQP